MFFFLKLQNSKTFSLKKYISKNICSIDTNSSWTIKTIKILLTEFERISRKLRVSNFPKKKKKK